MPVYAGKAGAHPTADFTQGVGLVPAPQAPGSLLVLPNSQCASFLLAFRGHGGYRSRFSGERLRSEDMVVRRRQVDFSVGW